MNACPDDIFCPDNMFWTAEPVIIEVGMVILLT